MNTLLHHRGKKQQALAFSTLVRIICTWLFIITSLLSISACFGFTDVKNDNTGRVHLVVAGKKDKEAVVLIKMYTLLLQHAGFDVTELPNYGDNDTIFPALAAGKIDLYPEYTGDGLQKLGLSTTHDLQKDYDAIKKGYSDRYHITWLAFAPLNDAYGICTTKLIASQFSLKKLSDIGNLPVPSIAAPRDAYKAALQTVEGMYSIKFQIVGAEKEEDTFDNVVAGRSVLNVCYTTDPLIQTKNFVLLEDDRKAFLDYHPAPIIRNTILHDNPEIETALDRLSPLLTSDVSIMLQQQIVAGFTPDDVVSTWLKSQRLL